MVVPRNGVDQLWVPHYVVGVSWDTVDLRWSIERGVVADGRVDVREVAVRVVEEEVGGDDGALGTRVVCRNYVDSEFPVAAEYVIGDG